MLVALDGQCEGSDDAACQIGARQKCVASKIRRNNTFLLLVGDVNHDGILEKDEISAMRLKMRNLFDVDESGSVDIDEIHGVCIFSIRRAVIHSSIA